MSEWILAGDVGGTKINLAIFKHEQDRLSIISEQNYATQDAASLTAVVERFLGEAGSPTPGGVGAGGAGAGVPQKPGAACLGVPGPARGDRIEGVNLPWTVDRRELIDRLGTSRVTLVNDLVATGYGVNVLPPACFAALNEVAPDPQGNAALIAPGTGLGETLLVRESDGRAGRWRALPSEGGHAGFAPASDLEIDLLRYLMAEFGHVSYERLLSGPGIHNIYRFLRDTRRGEEPSWLAERLRCEDPAALIAQAADEGTAPICEQALDLFTGILGTEAGNMALKILATGGVFLGGGIPPRLLGRLRGDIFQRAFNAKGRMTDLMDKFPIKVILEPKAALYGAAYIACIHGN